MSAHLQATAPWEASIPAFLQRQLLTRAPPLPPSLTLAGQTGLVTGANTGLGLAATRQLLALGLDHAVLAVRSRARAAAAAAALAAAFPRARVDVWIVDMASYASVRGLAARCAQELPRLDVVVLNAGVQPARFARVRAESEAGSDDGHELTLQVNYLSTVLLAVLLLPVLRDKRRGRGGAPARLSVVASDTAYWAKVPGPGPIFARFEAEDGFDTHAWYAGSKLLLILAVAKLAEHVDPQDVIVNTVNPGLVSGTSIMRDLQPAWLRPVVRALVWLVGRDLAAGASTYVDGAVVQGPESHGSYCSDWTIKP